MKKTLGSITPANSVAALVRIAIIRWTSFKRKSPLAFQLLTRLERLPSPAQQVVMKRASKMKQDYKGVELEIYSFTASDKVLYNIVFYIPTEDKKHWTPYDDITINDKGSLVKQPQ
jgi:hypothetical protein